jgi:hypothetical protein
MLFMNQLQIKYWCLSFICLFVCICLSLHLFLVSFLHIMTSIIEALGLFWRMQLIFNEYISTFIVVYYMKGFNVLDSWLCLNFFTWSGCYSWNQSIFELNIASMVLWVSKKKFVKLNNVTCVPMVLMNYSKVDHFLKDRLTRYLPSSLAYHFFVFLRTWSIHFVLSRMVPEGIGYSCPFWQQWFSGRRLCPTPKTYPLCVTQQHSRSNPHSHSKLCICSGYVVNLIILLQHIPMRST